MEPLTMSIMAFNSVSIAAKPLELAIFDRQK